MASGGMQLIGDKELRRKLLNLAENTRRKITRKAVSKAATPVVRAAKGKVPRESGALAKSLKKKIKTYKGTQTVVAIMGPDTKTKVVYKGKVRRPGKYGHLAHDGHVTTNGVHVPGTPFLKDAADEQQGTALNTLKTEMAAGIIQEARR